MRFLKISIASLLFCITVIGCSKNTAPPPPLTLEQFPAAFDKAFAKAKPDLKGAAMEVIFSVQGKSYAKAYAQLQTLGAMSDLSKEQSSLIGRGLLTLNSQIQAAAAQGDQNAAEAVKIYRSSK